MRALPDRTQLLLALMLLPAAVQAQADAAAEGAPKALQARWASSLLISDDLGTADAADGGAVLTLSPGLAYRQRGPQWQAQLDYSLNLLQTWRLQTQPRRVQHALSAVANTGFGDSGFSLGATASASQQARSAFGRQASGSGGGNVNPLNQNDVYTASLSPAFERPFGPWLQLRASHRINATNTRDSEQGDATGQASSLTLSETVGGPVRAAAVLSRSSSKPRRGRESSTESALLQLGWQPDVDWDFGLRGGRERSSLQQPEQRAGATYGASLTWRPGPRTTLSARADERVFGPTHAFSVEHRLRRLSFRFSDSRDVSDPGVVGASGALSNYQLLFAQYASLEPDEQRRDVLVRALLQQLGLSPDALVSNGFISSRPADTRSRQLGLSWRLQRTVLSLNASRSDSLRFGAASDANDDFSTSSRVRTQGVGLSLSHQLSPLSSLSLALQWQRNEGDATSLRTRLNAANLSWTQRLGPRQQASVLLRHSNFESTQRPYEENALLLTFTQQF